MPRKVKKQPEEPISLLPEAEDYRQLTDIEHVLKRSDMYMGNIKITDIPFWFMNEDLMIEKKSLQVSRSIFHIFSEMMTNASDNAALSRIAKYPVGMIQVFVNDKVVTIENNGVPIPIEKNKEGIYIPEMVFGLLRTGINFGDVENKEGKVNQKTKIRKGAGKNGLGAKIGNIYSKWFSVECLDTKRKKSYKQKWSKNMNIKEEAVIEDYEGEIDMVRIAYELEFSRFGYPEDFSYNQEIINALRFIACNNAISQKVPVMFNGKPLPYTVPEFANYWRKMKLPESPEDKILANASSSQKPSSENPNSNEPSASIPNPTSNTPSNENPTNNPNDPPTTKNENKITEPLFKDTYEQVMKEKEEAENEALSGEKDELIVELMDEIHALKEGEPKREDTGEPKEIYHIEWPMGTEFYKQKTLKDPNILPEVELYIFDKKEGCHGLIFSTTSGAINTDGGEHEKAVWALLLSIFESKFKNVTKDYVKTQLMKNMSAIVVFRATNPEFSDQSKVKLNHPKPTIVFSDTERRLMNNWYIITYIQELIDMQAMLNAKKTDGKKRRMINLDKLNDAGYAGKKGSEKTSLCYVEGKSALAYPTKMRDFIPNGINLIGTLFSKGKVINATNATVQKLIANEQYLELKQSLGLKEELDYTKLDNLATLRYGELLIMTDADHDGSHIKGLVLLLLSKRFPSLIKSGFVKFWCSPIIRASQSKGRKVVDLKTFYSTLEFEEWRKVEPNINKWKISYFKGLAGPSDAQIKHDTKHPKKITVQYDDFTDNYLTLAFASGYEDLRKKWISNYQPKLFDIRNMTHMTVSEFVAFELVEYSIYNVGRMIPSRYDGLKVSQRKAIDGSLKKWGAQAIQYGNEAEKLAELTSYCVEKTKYHHGNASMEGAIANMCQNYVGSNNLPVFIPTSQMGTRAYLGQDGGSDRYVYLMINPLLRKNWIKEEDDFILEYANEENQKCEPTHFEPVVNMLLINGSVGIGTGSMCDWPAHKVEDVCKAQLAFIDGKTMLPLIPNYQGFKGTVSVFPITKKEKVVKTLDLCYHKFDDALINPSSDYFQVIYEGSVKGNTKRAEITEIPPSISIIDYQNYLKSLVEKRVISSFDDNSTSNSPSFVIYKHLAPIKENLNLVEKLSLTNLVAIDELGRTVRYNNTNQYLQWWCGHRLSMYELRKNKVIEACKVKIAGIDLNIRFLDAYFAEKIVIQGKEDDDIKAQIEKLGFNAEMINKTTLGQLSKTKYQALIKKKEEAEKELKYYEEQPAKEIWRQEIIEFMKEYKIYLQYREDLKNELEHL